MVQLGEGMLLADKAQHALQTALKSGQLRGGQFLSMSQLVDLLDCPIAAIREAVKQACSQGLLVTLPKRGIQVMDVTPESIQGCLDFRMVLDQEGARRRISRGTVGQLPYLSKQHEKMRDTNLAGSATSLSQDAIATDLALHDFLADGLENQQLLAAYDANRTRIAIIQNARPFVQDRIKSAMDEHLAIIKALESSDVAAASQAIKYHFKQTLRWWGVA